MANKLYLLVSEGPTDILVVKKIAKKISENTSNTITIRELSPQKDANNRYPDHGWKEVKRWCRLYGKSIAQTENTLEAFAAKSKNWKAELAISRANGLIIQMDTDIVQYIRDIIPNYSGSTKNARTRFAKKAILDWLGEDNLPNEIYLLLSTTSTETWILATYERINSVFNDLPNDYDYEDIEDVVERLFTLGYLSYIDRETGKEKLSKTHYKPYAQRIVDNLVKVRLECQAAEGLCQKFES